MPHPADLAVLATKHASAAFRGDARASRGGTVNLKCGDSRRARGVAVTDETDRASTPQTMRPHGHRLRPRATAGSASSITPQQQPRSPSRPSSRDACGALGRARGGLSRCGVLAASIRAEAGVIDVHVPPHRIGELVEHASPTSTELGARTRADHARARAPCGASARWRLGPRLWGDVARMHVSRRCARRNAARFRHGRHAVWKAMREHRGRAGCPVLFRFFTRWAASDTACVTEVTSQVHSTSARIASPLRTTARCPHPLPRGCARRGRCGGCGDEDGGDEDGGCEGGGSGEGGRDAGGGAAEGGGAGGECGGGECGGRTRVPVI